MMQKPIHAVLLVGSPKGPNSTSNSLGIYLAERLQENGVSYEKVYLSQSLCSEEKQSSMLKLVDKSDLIILAFPLYVDSLHSQVIKTLELIAEHQKGKRNLNKKSLVAISNSGFPEAKHNNIALEVCRIFAKQVGFTYAGGLAMGGGGMISGRPLEEVGGAARNQIKALQISADALAKGEDIPETAVALMAKLGIPKWMYTWMGNHGLKKETKKNKVRSMYAQPCNGTQ
jgi:hypothetical protein